MASIEKAQKLIFELLKEEGLFLGGSSGINVAGAIKLVDRLEFSRANFTMAKDWVKG